MAIGLFKFPNRALRFSTFSCEIHIIVCYFFSYNILKSFISLPSCLWFPSLHIVCLAYIYMSIYLYMLCGTDTSSMELCRVGHMSWVFLRICHMSTCRVHFNIAVFVQHGVYAQLYICRCIYRQTNTHAHHTRTTRARSQTDPLAHAQKKTHIHTRHSCMHSSTHTCSHTDAHTSTHHICTYIVIYINISKFSMRTCIYVFVY